jgi:8-oxoguanine deaminase
LFTKISARYVLGSDGKQHTLIEDGEVVFQGDSIVFVGRGYDGPVDEERDYGQSLIMPGLIDLDALADIDHLILDSWAAPDVAAGHLWSEDYFANRRRDVFTRAERAKVREFALAQLALHGVTTYMPIASEIHSSWAESFDELVDMTETSLRIGLRGYLGPAYRSGVHSQACGMPIAFCTTPHVSRTPSSRGSCCRAALRRCPKPSCGRRPASPGSGTRWCAFTASSPRSRTTS